MRHKIVAVHDRQLEAFMQPWYVTATGAAIRAFQDELNKADSPLKAHPDDYDLYLIGEWDPQTGKIYCPDTPTMLAIGKNLVK